MQMIEEFSNYRFLNKNYDSLYEKKNPRKIMHHKPILEKLF
jgi:hypothetical protein